MATKTFVDFSIPVIDADWLNDLDALRYDTDGTGGAEVLPFLQSGTGAISRSQQSKSREELSVGDYAVATGLATALSRLNTNFSAGFAAKIPRGTWSMTTGAVFDGQRANLVGEGRQVSIIDFRPASADAAITYNNVSLGGMYQGRISGLGFTAGSNTTTKTAISLINTANVEVSHIGIATNGWQGADSIGIYTAGRQSLKLSYCEIACARPVVLARNATFVEISTDHYVLEHLELISTSATYSCIEFATNVMHTNTTLRNMAIVGGQDGIKWLGVGTPGTSYMLTIDQMRVEQGNSTVATGWGLRLEGALQSLNVRDAYFGEVPTEPNARRNGIKLRNAQQVLLQNCTFSQTSGTTALDMTFVSGSTLTLINCYFVSAAAITLSGARCVWKIEFAGRISGVWVYDPGTSLGMASGEVTSDVYHTGTAVTVPDTTNIMVAGQTYVGYLQVSTSQDTGALIWCAGATGATLVRDDPYTHFSNTAGTAGRTCVYWDAGTLSYRLQNNRGLGDITYRVYRLGGVV